MVLWKAPELGPGTNVGTFFTSKWHIVGALLMYRGGPKVKRYARKVRHDKRGVPARAHPILASFGKILTKHPMFLEIGNMWYDGRHQSWGP